MDLGLHDRVFLVTGGSSGLGFAGARTLTAEGARVVVAARDPEQLRRAVDDLGHERALGLTADLADPTAAERLVATTIARYGRLDGALISVGGPPAGSAMNTTDSDWTTAFQSVFLGPLRVARAAATAIAESPEMKSAVHGTSGSIVLVLSTSAFSPIPDLAISNGLRPGLAMLTKQLGDELGPLGIRVNAIAPGRFATDRVFDLDAGRGAPLEVRQQFENAIPLRRYGDPEEFGALAAFILSPRASYLTGTVTTLDGGASRQP